MNKTRGRTSIVKVIDNKPVFIEKNYNISISKQSSKAGSPIQSPTPRRSSLKNHN